jgi:hypothetical protein
MPLDELRQPLASPVSRASNRTAARSAQNASYRNAPASCDIVTAHFSHASASVPHPDQLPKAAPSSLVLAETPSRIRLP